MKKTPLENNPFQEPLFIYEMANNHMGSLEHGLKMIKDFAALSSEFPFRFAFKLQFRHLESFIHSDFQQRKDLKYIKRFSDTKLSLEEFRTLKAAIDDNGFYSICTPFDEASVDFIDELRFDFIKIASCSFTDWPLLERIVQSSKPIIASTAAATLTEMDKVVSFFRNRHKQLALMHCVGEYPTESKNLQLNQIDLLKRRYPEIPVGYSTHEDPMNFDAIPLAVAKGAMLFEKHVAIETIEFAKNAYSATPEQMKIWLQAVQKTLEICGVSGARHKSSEKEQADLRQFKRGVYAKRKIKKGEKIEKDAVFLAFPNEQGQLLANDLSKYYEYYAEQDIEEKAAVGVISVRKIDEREKVYDIVQRVKQLLRQSNVLVPGMASLEISHHYGLPSFEQFGCTLINIINREYCKKFIVLFPGQSHPEQFHKLKEESFLVLHGEVLITLDGSAALYKRGDIVTVHRGVRHALTTQAGAVIEEISSTHYGNDSYYTDEKISKNPKRKSILAYWMDTE